MADIDTPTPTPTSVPSFHVLDDTKPNDTTLPAFMVSTTRGFLPRADPIVTLPPDFSILESLLTRMPIQTLAGTPGLLAQGTLGSTVLSELPDLSLAISKYSHNLPLMNALYRDYSFLASAYLLEPCHLRFLNNEPYGLARDCLPATIAKPLAKVAALAGFKPFMEYAGSYALYNYRLADPSLGLTYSNLRLIRAFERGYDPTSSEAGFILVHVAMVAHSPHLVLGALKVLSACERKDRDAFNEGLIEVTEALKKINTVMEEMWSKSKPAEYNSFRTFIFGIKNQSMFPKGVVYEGVCEEPMFLRGESGANDSMIPLMDLLLQIPFPPNPLTKILHDFRLYRPSNHRHFLSHISTLSTLHSPLSFALSNSPSSSSRLYLLALNEIRIFRYRHWSFTREYILKRSRHGTATGGSPIVEWLPNQLGAVLGFMEVVGGGGKEGESKGVGEEGKGCEEILEVVRRQREKLAREVERLKGERGCDGKGEKEEGGRWSC
ncbi:MAG: hypothetical protein M1834_008962 [Cirrosporium novae-zelandiae]|nr:MAG: hypothetical protein M1834_008962 [Cirrosporium novae-zelandiae]